MPFSRLQVSHRLSRSISDSQQEKQISTFLNATSSVEISPSYAKKKRLRRVAGLVPPAFFWQEVSGVWPGMAPLCQGHRQLSRERTLRTRTTVI